MATTLSLPMLFYIEDNDLGISVKGDLQTPGSNIAKNLASFANLLVRDGDGCDPAESAKLLAECVGHVRGGKGPALVRLTVPRLSSHSGPDNQKGYRTDAEIAADQARDPLPRLRAHLVPAILSAAQWSELETEVARDVERALTAARARRKPDPSRIAEHRFADDTAAGPEAFGGMRRAERKQLGGTDVPAKDGEMLRFAEAVRRTLRHELMVNP
jgi:2-oxoisovalerate dehydrogenase E1 component